MRILPICMGVAPGSDCLVEYEDRRPETAGPMLRLWLLPEIGERVDLLVPLLPAPATGPVTAELKAWGRP